jgi:hypothetical protein
MGRADGVDGQVIHICPQQCLLGQNQSRRGLLQNQIRPSLDPSHRHLRLSHARNHLYKSRRIGVILRRVLSSQVPDHHSSSRLPVHPNGQKTMSSNL